MNAVVIFVVVRTGNFLVLASDYTHALGGGWLVVLLVLQIVTSRLAGGTVCTADCHI